MSVRIKVWKAQVKLFFTKSRFIESYSMKKKILVAFLVVVNAFVGWNLSINVPEVNFSIKWESEPMVFEQKAKASAIEPEVEEVAVVEEKAFDLVDYIFLKESSRGKNNFSKCEAIGKYNRYGFGIPGDGTGDYLCFEKDQDTVAVQGWVAQMKARGMSDNALLCYYNTGKATETCGDYLNLKK